MPKATVNGNEVEFEQGMNVLQVCELGGAEIPRFCYHERLQIAGNCRMCLVEIEGGPPKPAASCALPAGDGMVIHTDSPMVKKAREGVMEFLLINHPLDCPICDQGGECDLQDQAMAYGRGSNRFEENKRSVKSKDFGPLIKPFMTRCIHCTRCIRFLSDVAGVEEMGATGRGEDMEVGTFVEQSISSELSGNVIDLCPVGALTSRPYAFKARSWELRKTESIDVLDAVGSNIRVDSRGKEVMRILPRLNEEINEEWISDKTRFAYDGLKSQRLDRPYVRKKGKLQPVSWKEALEATAKALNKYQAKEIGAIAGDLADAEAMVLLKLFMDELGSPNYDCRQDGATMDAGKPVSYLFNSTIAGIEEADAILLIGANPRYEASLVNARIRKSWYWNRIPIASVGPELELTYPYTHIGDDVAALESIINDKHDFTKVLKKAKRPMVIVGSGVFTRSDADVVQHLVHKLCERYGIASKDWNGYNALHTAASRVGGLAMKFIPQKGGKDTKAMLHAAKKGDLKLLYLYGADEIDFDGLDKTFLIYQGHHGDKAASHADIILPGAAYTEKSGTYINLEGRVQQTERAIFPPGDAKEDWQIVRDVINACGYNAPIDSIKQVREMLKNVNPWFAQTGVLPEVSWQDFGKNGKPLTKAFANPITNFYMTDPISRASKTMAACVDEFLTDKSQKRAA